MLKFTGKGTKGKMIPSPIAPFMCLVWAHDLAKNMSQISATLTLSQEGKLHLLL